MQQQQRVLFVCTHNANRSQMAEAFARMHGEGVLEAYSAGSAATGQINPRAVRAMAEKGYDLTTHASQRLDEVPDGPYDYVITMGCGDDCPFVPARHREDWDLPDPKAMEPAAYNAVRDEVERRVLDLLERVRLKATS